MNYLSKAFLKMAGKRILRNWRELRRLSWRQRWLLLQAFAILPVIVLGLRLLGYQRLRSLLLRLSSAPPDHTHTTLILQQGQETARLTQAAASRLPFWVSCLAQSITIWWLLRRQSLASDIRIGVNRNDGDFQAHAWVEINGIILNDKADVHQRYSPFDQIPLSSKAGRT